MGPNRLFDHLKRWHQAAAEQRGADIKRREGVFGGPRGVMACRPVGQSVSICDQRSKSLIAQ